MGSNTKHYKGGAAQNLWKYTAGSDEALPLTADYAGTSMAAMWWNGRVYFISDRDGTMNIWSMDANGKDLKQHTHHKGLDVKSPSLSDGKIVYQNGADLWLYDIAANKETKLAITLSSDFDQLRERWVKKPMDYLTDVSLSPDGDRVVLTARGQVFLAPVKPGRLVRNTRNDEVRYRRARFMPNGKSVLALTDESGELEFCSIPANGIGDIKQLTDNGKIFRYDGVPSPDGKMIAYNDKNLKLWIFDTERNRHTLVVTSDVSRLSDFTWSPDSKWLAYVGTAENFISQIHLYNVPGAYTVTLTDDRCDSYSPAWTPDGKWIYYLSDRTFTSVHGSVWGNRQTEPFIDDITKIYYTPLKAGERSPFWPDNELTAADTASSKKDDKEKKSDSSGVTVAIDTTGIMRRVMEVSVPAGNYSSLATNGKQLFWVSRESLGRSSSLSAIEIKNEDVSPKTLVDNISGYELSMDGKKILVRKRDNVFVIDASANPPGDLSKAQVDLAQWKFSIDPRLEFRQMFREAWRLERDYFYDKNMNGVDWKAMLAKYTPLANRVTDRYELSDVFGQLISELSALHMYVFGGDMRGPEDTIDVADLGAVLERDQRDGGYRVAHVYQYDPDYPEDLSPLARPEVEVKVGDIIQSINGVDVLSVPQPADLLRDQSGQQVRIHVKSSDGKSERDVIVKPLKASQARDLRYNEWEYTRRLRVEDQSDSQIGYVHLRATSTGDFAQWARDFYPAFNRPGLIIDVRNNNGGNIDSWIIERIMRKAWAWWQSREGIPYSNMQYAFRGHVAVLCNEWTVSDGELFTEGMKRLGLAKIIGTRTLGGEIWLSFGTVLVDRGIATAAESGVYAPDGEWLIEGHGVDPDIVVDNLPHATYNGSDAQLDAAIGYLKEQIQLHPVEIPKAPAYPDKAIK
jgi:tricorn protease